MKKIVLFLTLLNVITVYQLYSQDSLNFQSEEEIYNQIFFELKPRLDRYYQGDPASYAELCAEDVTYWTGDHRIEGKEKLINHFNKFKGRTNKNSYEVLIPKLDVQNNLALLSYRLDEFTNPETPDRIWRATELYRKEGNNWKIFHAHWSSISKESISLKKSLVFSTGIILVLIGFISGWFIKKRR